MKVFVKILIAAYMVVSLAGLVYLYLKVEQTNTATMQVINKAEKENYSFVMDAEDVPSAVAQLQRRLEEVGRDLSNDLFDLKEKVDEIYYEVY